MRGIVLRFIAFPEDHTKVRPAESPIPQGEAAEQAEMVRRPLSSPQRETMLDDAQSLFATSSSMVPRSRKITKSSGSLITSWCVRFPFASYDRSRAEHRADSSTQRRRILWRPNNTASFSTDRRRLKRARRARERSACRTCVCYEVRCCCCLFPPACLLR